MRRPFSVVTNAEHLASMTLMDEKCGRVCDGRNGHGLEVLGGSRDLRSSHQMLQEITMSISNSPLAYDADTGVEDPPILEPDSDESEPIEDPDSGQLPEDEPKDEVPEEDPNDEPLAGE
jgi:hypothetical protein